MHIHDSVANLVLREPAAIPEFRRLDIDFCPGRKRTLALSRRSKGLDPKAVVGGLRSRRELTGCFVPPNGACTAGNSLYLGPERLRLSLYKHICLETNAPFFQAQGG